MVYIRFSGAGWLSPLIVFASLILGVWLGASLTSSSEPGPAVGLVVAATMLATAPVHWLIGAALNSEATQHGRVWHNGHTVYGAPMQRAAGVHVAFAVISVAFVIGGTTTPILGWAFALLVPIVAWVVHAARADRRRVRPLADRRALAEARGWRYKNSDAALATRWRKRDRARAPYASLPFGIVAGTVNQLPFTAFDTEGDHGRHTNWAVHLPVSFPRIVVWGPAPPPGPSSFDGLADQFFGGAQGGAAMRDMFAQMAQRPEVDADDPEFAAALATPEIRQATAALDLRGWLIDGRDMILSRNYSPTAPCPATEVAAVADRLASLFYRFPLDAAQRWGSTPTTDVPLADAAR